MKKGTLLETLGPGDVLDRLLLRAGGEVEAEKLLSRLANESWRTGTHAVAAGVIVLCVKGDDGKLVQIDVETLENYREWFAEESDNFRTELRPNEHQEHDEHVKKMLKWLDDEIAKFNLFSVEDSTEQMIRLTDGTTAILHVMEMPREDVIRGIARNHT